jgi:hypothetical protein
MCLSLCPCMAVSVYISIQTYIDKQEERRVTRSYSSRCNTLPHNLRITPALLSSPPSVFHISVTLRAYRASCRASPRASVPYFHTLFSVPSDRPCRPPAASSCLRQGTTKQALRISSVGPVRAGPIQLVLLYSFTLARISPSCSCSAAAYP